MAPYEGIVYPDDLDELCALFKTICASQQIAPGSDAAELLAKQIVVLYEAGMCRKEDLLTAFSARKAA